MLAYFNIIVLGSLNIPFNQIHAILLEWVVDATDFKSRLVLFYQKIEIDKEKMGLL